MTVQNATVNCATGEVTYADVIITPPTPEEARAAMPPLSFAQLLIGLVAEGWITEAEGEALLAGWHATCGGAGGHCWLAGGDAVCGEGTGGAALSGGQD